MTQACDRHKVLTRLTIGAEASFVGRGTEMYKGSEGFQARCGCCADGRTNRERCFAIQIACAVFTGICVVLFGRSSRAGYVAPQLWRCGWAVRVGWQAVSRDLG